MAKVDFNNMQDDAAYSTAANTGNDVGFFTLRNDKDEAIVRFMCDSTDDFEILTVHDIKLGDKYRKVNCIRDFHDPIEACPLCASGAKINQRFFIKLIQYDKVQDPTTGGVNVILRPMLWERSTAYAKTLKSYIDNYGPMSDVICKIIRHGKAGDMQTTYEIVPNLNKSIYKDEIYVKDTNLFGDFQAFGTVVMDRTYDEIMQYQMTGQFPVREKKQPEAAAQVATPTMNQSYAAPQFNQPVANNFGMATPTMNQAPAETYTQAAPTMNPAAPQQPIQPGMNSGWGQPTPRATMPWDNNATQQNMGGFDRPRRY